MRPALPLLKITRPIVFVVMLIPYLLASRASYGMLALCTIGAAFFLASSAVVVGWIPAPRGWKTATLWLETGMVTLLNAVAAANQLSGPMPVLYGPVLTSLFLTLDREQWLPVLGTAAFSWLLTSLPAWLRQPQAFLDSGLYAISLLFCGLMGLLLRNAQDQQQRSTELLRELADSRAALERAHRQLQASAARQQETAVLEERQRLAREIHDSVAHSLTALVVQTQVGRRLLARAPEDAAAALARCEGLAREALQETRRAVRALHPAGLEQQSEAEALGKLATDFALATGINIRVEAGEAVRALPPDPVRLEQLYRIFQEALTNAHRHGAARQVTATLAAQDGQLLLAIRNDGAPPRSLEPGIGLRSMQERAGSIGGSVRFEPGERGLAIHVSVPLKQEASL